MKRQRQRNDLGYRAIRNNLRSYHYGSRPSWETITLSKENSNANKVSKIGYLLPTLRNIDEFTDEYVLNTEVEGREKQNIKLPSVRGYYDKMTKCTITLMTYMIGGNTMDLGLPYNWSKIAPCVVGGKPKYKTVNIPIPREKSIAPNRLKENEDSCFIVGNVPTNLTDMYRSYTKYNWFRNWLIGRQWNNSLGIDYYNNSADIQRYHYIPKPRILSMKTRYKRVNIDTENGRNLHTLESNYRDMQKAVNE